MTTQIANTTIGVRTSWRNHPTHRAETTAVKRALTEAGITARVRHDTGTAWSWLVIEVDGTEVVGRHHKPGTPCVVDCPACEVRRGLYDRVMEIVKRVTGRTGEYSGRISVTVNEAE